MMDVLSPEGMQQLVKEVKALGVPAGGTAGQVLAKVDDTNYNTQWVDQTEGVTEHEEYLVKAPIGTIVIWSGSESAIPEGWQFCDGTNGTPDLRDKFVVGAGTSYEVGAVGGEKEHVLTTQELAKHRHNEMAVTDLENPQQARFVISNISGATMPGVAINGTPFTATTASAAISTEYEGDNQPHNNLPPYYALCYIMKISPDPAVDGVTQAELTQALATKQDAFEDGSTLELTANARTAGGRMEVKTPVQSVLTQAEYDALSEEKKNKGLYVISDGGSGNGGGGGSSSDVYSTEETRIGTWIDGKPLYQRTWSANSAATGQVWTETGVVIENLDKLVDYSVMGKTNTSNVLAKLPFFENVGSYAAVNYWTGTDGKTGFCTFCYHQSGNYFYNMPLHITARYTKTTDTGGAT